MIPNLDVSIMDMVSMLNMGIKKKYNHSVILSWPPPQNINFIKFEEYIGDTHDLEPQKYEGQSIVT